ncbi:MAG TPA: hypothetical protein PL126_02535 [Candidatus Cloacimonadota bacterium]|nr:hypothetical protein [Candidatus Cloacimonadota bacterium]
MIKILIALLSILSLSVAAWAIRIYDVQFTTINGVDNSYPSPYVGKEVSLEGVVTATDYTSGGYFISEPIGGAWRGIFISDKRNRPSAGDKVLVKGRVHEHFGMTCLADISSFKVLDRNCGLPQPVLLTTSQLSRAEEAEAYEGVYVKVMGAQVSSAKSKAGRFIITDGSGQCAVKTGTFGKTKALSPAVGTTFSSIVGVVVYGFSEFTLNPIDASDTTIHQPLSIQNRSWGRIKSIYK